MMGKVKTLHLDLETTGLDPRENGVIQIGGIVEIDGNVEDEFDLLVRPFEADAISEEALKVNDRTVAAIARFPAPHDVHAALKAVLEKYVDCYDRMDKFQLVGFNVTFDDRFFREWFSKCGDTYYGSLFFWPPIDVAGLAAEFLKDRRADLQNFKLLTVAETVGLKVDPTLAHDALYDVRLTREVYRVVTRGGQ